MSKLLINEQPLQVLPSLAKLIGLNEAIIIQQLHYWLNASKNERDGHKWVYNTYEDWAKQFPFWSVSTIRRAINNLEQKGLLITTDEYNKMPIDKTKWYRIDYSALEKQVGEIATAQNEQSEKTTAQNEQPRLPKMDSPVVQNEQTHLSKMNTPITRENTEKTTEKEPEKTKATAAIFSFYEANIGPLTPHIADRLGACLDEYPEEWVRQAIEVAAERNKRSIAYIEAVLKGCKAEGKPPKAPISFEKKIARQYKLPDGYAARPAPEPPLHVLIAGEGKWREIDTILKGKLPQETYDSWLADAVFLGLEDEYFRVGVDRIEAQKMLGGRLYDVILPVVQAVTDAEADIRFELIGEALEETA